jgi:hypothetical protein
LKNIFSVFVSNPQYAGKLKMVKINLRGKRRPFFLKKIRDDLYVTNPVLFDEAQPDVGLIGLKISAPPNVVLEHGFSFSTPAKKEETFKQPPKGRPIILSIFVKNPENVYKIESVKWVQEDNMKRIEPIEVKKINENLYVTQPITFPVQKFKIVVDALDHENHKIIWVSLPKFQAIDTSNY